MEQIRVARVFQRWDVDAFLDEISEEQFAEQVVYDQIVSDQQAELERRAILAAERRRR